MEIYAVNVIVIENNVVHSNDVFIGNSVEKACGQAERLFKSKIKNKFKVSKSDINAALEDGYYEYPGGSICISHAEITTFV